jgi:hypothetical protein
VSLVVQAGGQLVPDRVILVQLQFRVVQVQGVKSAGWASTSPAIDSARRRQVQQSLGQD